MVKYTEAQQGTLKMTKIRVWFGENTHNKFRIKTREHDHTTDSSKEDILLMTGTLCHYSGNISRNCSCSNTDV